MIHKGGDLTMIEVRQWAVGLVVAAMLGSVGWAAKEDKVDPDKEKALANPYANDLGPDSVDTSKYPKEVVKGYALLKEKCTKCHTASRPLNAQFVELSKADLEKFKKAAGKYADDPALYKVDDGVWKRYVKRMASKPGCELKTVADQKTIHQFLVYDSIARKTGDQMEAWVKHRKGLLEEFKKKYPKRYEELYASEPPKEK